jgi:hypothetical protein
MFSRILEWFESRHLKTTVGRFAVEDYLRTGSIQNLKEVFPRTYFRVAKQALEAEEQKARQARIDYFFGERKRTK